MPPINDLIHAHSSLADFKTGLAHYIGQDSLNIPWDWDVEQAVLRENSLKRFLDSGIPASKY